MHNYSLRRASPFMADIVPDPNSYKVQGTATSGIAGESINPLQAVYLNGTTLELAGAQALTTSRVSGISLSNGVSGEEVLYLPVSLGNRINFGVTLQTSTVYVLSRTLGGISLTTDLQSGDYFTYLGLSDSLGDWLLLQKHITGVQI